MAEPSNSMREQVLATPAALRASFAELERRARLVVPTPEIYRTRRIVLIGSGDSYFAAKAAEAALLHTTGIAVEVRTPLQAGRYHAQLSARRELENTLVVALSNSGGAARVAEAASLYLRAGARVLAVTKAPESRLAGLADHVLHVPVPALPSAPGFGPYLFAFIALVLLGIRFGEVRMGILMDEAQARRGRLLSAIDALERVIADADAATAQLAQAFGGTRLFEFLGAGPSEAVADYGAAKLLEASGEHALSRELEEWTHLNYFDATPADIATVLVVPADSVAQNRAVELVSYMHKLGRRLVLVGGGAAAEAVTQAGGVVLPVPSAVPETWSPLLTSAPLALFAAYLAALRGADYGRGGQGAWSDSSDASTVQKSALWEPQA